VRVEKDADAVRLVVHGVDGEELQSRRFSGGITARVSPDGKRFLVTRKAMDDPIGFAFFRAMDASELEELLVGDGREWTNLESLIEGLSGDHVWISWGGPTTLVATNQTANAIAPLQSGTTWTSLLGRWP